MKAFICVRSFAVLVLFLGYAGVSTAQDQPPPRSDTITNLNNFLACKGNKFSLCYYSGPDSQTGQPSLPCDVQKAGVQADCKCYSYDDGKQWNYVAIDSILNPEVRSATETTCGETGADCINLETQFKCQLSGLTGKGNCQFAPVCETLGAGGAEPGPQTLYPKLPGDYSISTFSFQHAESYPIGSTSCNAGVYAGCMTAPCQLDENGDFSTCSCPTYYGEYQIGQTLNSNACDLQKTSSGKHVWSAANLEISD